MNMDDTVTAGDAAFYAGSAHARGDANARLHRGASDAEKKAWAAGVRCGERIKHREREQGISDRRRAKYEPRH